MDKALFQTYQSYLKWERLAAEWEALKNSSDPYLADLQEEVFKGLNAPLEASLGAETSLMDAYLKEGSSEDPSEQLGALIAFGREQTEARLRRELNLRLEGETQDLRTARYFMEETEARSALTGEILKSYPSLDYGYHREAAREINEMRGELKKGNLFSTAQHYLYGRDALTREAVYSDGREAFKNYEVETKIKGLGIVIAAAAVSHAAAGAAILAGAAAPEAAATFIAPLGFTGTTRAFHGRLWNPDLSTAGNIGDWVVDYALTASMFKYLGVVTRGLAGESGGVLARYAAESAGFATYTPMENVVHQAIAGHGFDEQLFLDQTASPQALLDQQLMLLGLKAGGYPLRLTMRPLDRAVQNEVVQRHWQRYLDALEKGGENVSGLRGLRLAPIAGGSGRPPALPAQVLLPQTRIWFERLRGELQEVEKEALAEAKALEEGMGKDAALRARVASTHRAAAAQKFLLSNSNRPTVGEIVMALQAHPGDPVPFLVLAALTAQGNSLAGDVLLGQARRGNAEAARALDTIDFTQTEEMVTERLLRDPRMVELLFAMTAWGHTKSFFLILELTDRHPETKHLKEEFQSLPVDRLRQRLEKEGDAEIGRLLYMLWDFFGNEGARDVMAQAD
ncbi:MAG: hypothetical protein HY609_03835, partial [Deltaproteobacteria bacterium]|nr:hypothetical protein [Deltaproteobacteria bacterium]